jgi:hypothetical protein
MSGRGSDVIKGVAKAAGFCVLSFLLSTVAGGAALSASGQPPPRTPVSTSRAATLALLHTVPRYIPFAGGTVRDAPFDPWNPNSTPIPAPVATNQYACLTQVLNP